MTVLTHFDSQPVRARLIGLVAAVGVGLVAATQSAPTTFLLFALLVFSLAAAITPLAAFAVLLIIAPIRALFAAEAALQLPLDLGQIALAGVLAAWVVKKITRGERLLAFTWTPVYIPLLALIAVTGASFFSATSLGAWLTEWLKWVLALVLIAVVMDVGKNRRWEWLVFGLVMAGAANAVIGLYEFLGGSGAEHLLINNRFFRAFGTFGQPNPFGAFMGLVAPVALMATWGYGWRLWRGWRATRRIDPVTFITTGFYGLAAGLITLGVFISWSRGAWLAFGAAMIVMAVALPRKFWQSVLLFMVIIVVGGSLWFSGKLPASIVDRINSATQELFVLSDVRSVDINPDNYAIVERLAHWQAALNMIRQHPWTGVGFGNYEIVYPDYRLMNWHEPLGHAHNYYLNIWAETGIIGLLSFGALWLYVIWLTWRTRQHPDSVARSLVIGLMGTWVYLIVHSLLDNLLVNNLFLHVGVMLGLLSVLHHQIRSQRFVEHV